MASNMYLQQQEQLLRSAEASKQMLYSVYGNVISILEELERRELEELRFKVVMPSSNIPIPNQSNKTFEDIESIVSGQILCFEALTKACPAKVLEEVKQELKQLTISWAAVREERGLPRGNYKTDIYVSNLYEVLAKGSTQHNIPKCESFGKEAIREGFRGFIGGSHEVQVLDNKFRKDEKKRATAPDMRESKMLDKGAQRIAGTRSNKELDKCLNDDLRKVQEKEQEEQEDMK